MRSRLWRQLRSERNISIPVYFYSIGIPASAELTRLVRMRPGRSGTEYPIGANGTRRRADRRRRSRTAIRALQGLTHREPTGYLTAVDRDSLLRPASSVGADAALFPSATATPTGPGAASWKRGTLTSLRAGFPVSSIPCPGRPVTVPAAVLARSSFREAAHLKRLFEVGNQPFPTG